MSLVTNLQSAFTRVATEFKSIRTLIGGSGTSDTTALTTTSKNLVGAINEVAARPNSSSLATLTDVTLSGTKNTGDIIRFNSSTSKWEETDPTTYLQPLDSDLTAIAALATTAYGRAFLTLVNTAALMGLLSSGTVSAAGILQLATVAQAQTGTDTALAVTAAGVKAAIDQRIDNTATLGSSTTNAPSQAAVKAYADGLLDANNAYQYKGVIDCSTNPNYPAASAGWSYKVSVAGKIGGASGPNVEVGDTLICLVDGTAAGTQASVGANWNILQTNIDGAVVGPATSTAGDFATFSGTTGKIVQDSGISLDTDTTMAANSDARIPSQKAVRGYTYSQTQIGDITTDFAAGFVTALS